MNESILTFRCYRKKYNFRKLKKYIIIMIIFISIIIPTKVFADTENEIMNNTQEKFNINSFIKEADKYTGDFLEDVNLGDMLNQAIQGKVDNKTLYQKIFKMFGKEITVSLKTLISILVIIVIHGILKSVTDNLENKNISQIIYFVQYILIVTLIMSNFTEIIKIVKNTADDLVGFTNVLMPLLLTLMMYTGSIATTSLLEPIILFAINFIANLIKNILIPIVLIIVVFSIISKISEKMQIEKLSKFLKSSVVWVLGIFVGVVSLEGTLSSSVDGITAKTAKSAVSTIIPVVGKVLGDVVDSVLGCGIILKNAIGLIGVIIVIGICITPIIKIATMCIMYSLASAVVQPIADDKIVKVLDEMGGVFKLLLGILCSLSVMLIVGITLVIKISNSGMMYR